MILRIALGMLALAGALLAADPLPYTAFQYIHYPINLKETAREKRGDVVVRDITYVNTSKGRTAAYLVEPPGKAKGPGILFVHWYEPKSPTSNRKQFLEQAVELARLGATSLLIDTMWSDPKWFDTRNPNEDYLNSMRQVMELRRAVEVLTFQRRVDPNYVAYVGHDFGAMYGAILAGTTTGVQAYALQAGTTYLSHWYLLGRKLDDAGQKRVQKQLEPLAPLIYMPSISPSTLLLQFGKSDPYVSRTDADALSVAAPQEVTKVLWYDAGHELNEQAVRDRQQWLREQLKMK